MAQAARPWGRALSPDARARRAARGDWLCGGGGRRPYELPQMSSRAARIAAWFKKTENLKNLARMVGGVSFFSLALLSMKRVAPGHVGLIEDRAGNLRPYVYDDGQLVLAIPIWQRCINIRLIPVKKRFIKEFKTKDGRDVEVRLLCRLQPKVHWVPEIYYKFGKDYGRGFLEKEATVDISEVVKNHTFEELVRGSEDAVDAIAEEISDRLYDACAFHKIKVAKEETTIVFLDPEADVE
uniref:Band 7 domain-containing protein n=1 Tax=Alexandrium monilatum TaxID=311494 RepID=A0A7S4PSM1_9DINO